MYSSHEKAEEERRGPAICQVRTTDGDGSTYGARRVIIIIDKPQKPFPAEVWNLSPVVILPPPAPEPVLSAASATIAQAHFGF